MRAVIITAVVIVLILAIGIPIIHYATKADKSTISARTLATGRTVKETVPQEIPQETQQPSEPAEEELSAKEVLEQYKQKESLETTAAGPKVGYTIGYLLNQSKAEQQSTCQPLLDAAQKKIEDAELDVEAKQRIYDRARDELRELIDEGADESEIDNARDDLERAKEDYEDALAAKYTAQDELVEVRVQCASYLS